jgi:hypothetical protein
MLTASLSDGSAPDFVKDQGNNVTFNLPGVYEIQYAANSSGQTLRVVFVLTEAKDPFSNAQVHAVSLGFPPKASIPTLSTFGLLLLVATLGLTGVLMLRRRQAVTTS